MLFRYPIAAPQTGQWTGRGWNCCGYDAMITSPDPMQPGCRSSTFSRAGRNTTAPSSWAYGLIAIASELRCAARRTRWTRRPGDVGRTGRPVRIRGSWDISNVSVSAQKIHGRCRYFRDSYPPHVSCPFPSTNNRKTDLQGCNYHISYPGTTRSSTPVEIARSFPAQIGWRPRRETESSFGCAPERRLGAAHRTSSRMIAVAYAPLGRAKRTTMPPSRRLLPFQAHRDHPEGAPGRFESGRFESRLPFLAAGERGSLDGARIRGDPARSSSTPERPRSDGRGARTPTPPAVPPSRGAAPGASARRRPAMTIASPATHAFHAPASTRRCSTRLKRSERAAEK